ncbi:LysR family transcriptional regulator [Aquincola sp. J276]|uniref:LysR family transcriptional regulator n=1 Tax=Aquincola sp. J276 TaxID=2898432 RepID=UPI002150B32A|nr:LysR family transcriptional regulator [Aquincola sp. J276]MCR5864130.1 LysR family transcriptional regulator [Aquincola sp. J276]
MAKATLADLVAFQTVAAHRSFRQAADALGQSRSALSHAMRGLEAQLGARLLNRTTRSVAPTELGQRLLERIGPLLRELDDALAQVSQAQGRVRGTLRINTSESAARLLLQQVVPRFLAAHPDVELDLVADGRLVDVVEQGFDAGIRLGESLPQDMVGVPIGGPLRFIAVASPGYLVDRAPPALPEDLRQHRCIRQRLPSGKRYRWEFMQHGQEVAVDVPGALTLDNVPLMVEAALRGLGIAYVPETAAQAELDAGRLVRVLDDWCPPVPGLFLYFPANRHMPAPLRAFVDLLGAAQPGPA